MKVEELVHNIKLGDIVIPEFQREFVWGLNRSKELIQSLINEYPIGGILIWKTSTPPQLKGKGFSKGAEENRSYQVLLDGQQRSTALYMLTTGEIPPYYNQNEINSDPRDLAYNLFSGELRYWHTSMSNDKSWQLVTDCILGNVNHVQIAFDLYQKYSKLAELIDFEFDFGNLNNSRYQAFLAAKTLFKQANLNLFFASQQIWRIGLPSKTITTTIAELADLYEKSDAMGEEILVPQKFMNFWKRKVVPEVENILSDYSNQERLVTKFNDNFNKIVSITKREILSQEIPSSANFADAIDIFDKINSMGVHLGISELALTHITAIWPDARRQMKKTLERLEKKGFELDLNLTTRLLVAHKTGRGALDAIGKASFEPIRIFSSDELSSGWEECNLILEYLIDILTAEKITSSNLIKSKNVLIPIFKFLSLSGGSFQNDNDRKRAIYWFHLALIWGRYAGSTDQRLEEDLNLIKQSAPWEKLVDKIIDQRGRIKIEASDLQGQGSSSRFFNSFCIMLSHKRAKDWFNGLELNFDPRTNYSIHKHHIFPIALLERSGFSESNDIQRAFINEIGNLSILTGTTNISISDKSPFDYFPEIISNYPDALSSQLIPDNDELWKRTNFLDFLSQRRSMIADAMNKFLDNYLSGLTEVDIRKDVSELILQPESETLEFKETWAYDIRQSEQNGKPTKNAKLQLSCIKTVAAFLNSNGGSLFIGVSDDNQLIGLERDISLTKLDKDKFERNISEVLMNALGASKKPYYSINLFEIDEHVICKVETKPCNLSKNWVAFEGEQLFFIRNGNSTISLKGAAVDDYWESKIA
jgi:hypothetical protein